MDVIVSLEHRFNRTPDGKVWTQTTFSYPFWDTYLRVFDHIKLIARVRNVDSITSDWKQVNGERVSFIALPYYVGPWQYLLKLSEIKKIVRTKVQRKDAFILRLPSQIATSILADTYHKGHPYGVEVVADPYDVFAPGSVRHPLRPFFRCFSPRRLRKQCADSFAVSYVTRCALQKRYPPADSAFTTYYSDVELPDSAFAFFPRTFHAEQSEFTIIHVGTMSQLYKAQDTLLEAACICMRQGIRLNVVFLGDGQYRAFLENKAKQLGIGNRVKFQGQVTSGEDVYKYLRTADLFVLPSHQEGLPRAMLEAMALGLPCIGSTVGGFPELLAREYLVPPGNPTVLARKISDALNNPSQMMRMSLQNLNKAKRYRADLLHKRRVHFYQKIKEGTEVWLKSYT